MHCRNIPERLHSKNTTMNVCVVILQECYINTGCLPLSELMTALMVFRNRKRKFVSTNNLADTINITSDTKAKHIRKLLFPSVLTEYP